MDNNNTKTVVKHFDIVIYASIINEQSVNNKKAMMASKRKKRRAMVTHGKSYIVSVDSNEATLHYRSSLGRPFEPHLNDKTNLRIYYLALY
jgi:hypothetical protein